jgi:uncharacterized membrane protein
MFNRLSYKEEVHLLVLIHMLDFEKQTEFLLSVLFCFIDYLAYISLNCEKREDNEVPHPAYLHQSVNGSF